MSGKQWFVAQLTWDAVQRRLSDGAAAILPIGAGAKEHGLHLPMNTDEIQADWIARKVATRFNALIWPTIRYGHYPAFTAYPGSISLSHPVFTAMVAEIIAGITHWKPPVLFVIDTGISTIGPVEAAVAGQGWPVPVVHLRIHGGPSYISTAARLRQQQFGTHADELETSRMLVIAPDQVDMSQAEATPQGPIEGPLTLENAPSGSYGDPALATAEKGQALLDAMMEDIFATVGRSLSGR
jgi:creatinine amidohydrolase